MKSILVVRAVALAHQHFVVCYGSGDIYKFVVIRHTKTEGAIGLVARVRDGIRFHERGMIFVRKFRPVLKFPVDCNGSCRLPDPKFTFRKYHLRMVQFNFRQVRGFVSDCGADLQWPRFREQYVSSVQSQVQHFNAVGRYFQSPLDDRRCEPLVGIDPEMNRHGDIAIIG